MLTGQLDLDNSSIKILFPGGSKLYQTDSSELTTILALPHPPSTSLKTPYVKQVTSLDGPILFFKLSILFSKQKTL